MPNPKIYLVGGAVRDQLLNRPIKEKDWVVVGATPETMIAQGYKPVGKDFPVFLHPTTHEEYALARSEKKVAKGYQGFTFYTDPNVTLEQDLMRRDLTINAIAQDEHGTLIDPYDGAEDLKHKQLRHVSPAFVEDPVRLLRLARFAAMLPDFSIHPDTLTLLKEIVSNGEVDALVPERVWAECVKTCDYDNFLPFFETLQKTGALAKIFPGLQPEQLSEDNYQAMANSQSKPIMRWAALWHRVDPQTTKQLMQHLKAPKQWQDYCKLTQLAYRYFANSNLTPESLFDLVMKMDGLRRTERFLDIISILKSCYPNKNIPDCITLIERIKSVPIKALVDQGLKGEQLANAIYQKRLQAISQI